MSKSILIIALTSLLALATTPLFANDLPAAGSTVEQIKQKMDTDMQQLKADRDKLQQDMKTIQEDRTQLMHERVKEKQMMQQKDQLNKPTTTTPSTTTPSTTN